MSQFLEVIIYFGHFLWLLAPGILITLLLVALACYGFQMIRLFFKF
jgi:hypothetical protein